MNRQASKDRAPTSRLILADDHTLFRQGLRLILQADFPDTEILDAGDMEQLRTCLVQAGPDPLLMLGVDPDGFVSREDFQWLRSEFPEIPILAMANTNDPVFIRAIMQLGAKGFFPKTVGGTGVVSAAIRLVRSGSLYLPPVIMEALLANPEPVAARTRPRNFSAYAPPLSDDLFRQLTPRQQEVISLLAHGRSNRQIAQALGLAEGTVKIHISGILRALNVPNRSLAAEQMRRLRSNPSDKS